MDELALLKTFRLEDAAPAAAREHARTVLRAAVARQQRARRRTILAVAFVGAAVLVGTAYGVARELVVGDPAPEEVRQQPARFGHAAELIPVPHPEDPRLEQARVSAILDSSAGTVYLFSSLNASGLCASTWIEGDRGYEGRLDMTTVCGRPEQSFYALAQQRYGERTALLLSGRAGDGVARVALRFGERTLDVPLTGRWFLAELVESQPDEFVAYDNEGRVVEQRTWPAPPGPVAPVDAPQPVTEPREIARIAARRGSEEVTLTVARSTAGGYCQTVASDRRRSNASCFVPRPKPREIGIGAMNFGGGEGILLLVGPAGSEVASLELRYEDGRVVEVPLHDGWALFEVRPADYVEGRRPEILVGRDASGQRMSSVRLPWAKPSG